MAPAISGSEREIRDLERDEHEQLLRALLQELNGPPDSDLERVWLEEAHRRSRELDSGAVDTAPADEVFDKGRDQLKRR